MNDLLAILAGALKAKDPHWLEKGGVFTAEDLKAIGHALTAKTVGDLEHCECDVGVCGCCVGGLEHCEHGVGAAVGGWSVE